MTSSPEPGGFSRTYSFSAPPEVVFNTLIDPDRTARWLPPGMSLERRDRDKMVLRTGGRLVELRIAAGGGQMRVDGAAAGPGLQGSVQVSQAPAGGSSLKVEIDSVAAERIQPMVEDAVGRLRRDVDDNFNAG